MVLGFKGLILGEGAQRFGLGLVLRSFGLRRLGWFWVVFEGCGRWGNWGEEGRLEGRGDGATDWGE